MRKRTKIGLFLGLAYLIDRIFYPDKYKKKEPELIMGGLQYTPAPGYEPIKFENPKDILCPYCNYRFEEMLKRSRKCPECKKYIYRKKNYENKVYQLITEEQFEKEREESLKNYSQSIQENEQSRLLGIQEVGFKKVKILDSGESSCPACRKQNGKIFLIEDAVKERLLPCKDCTNDYCRCVYIQGDIEIE